MRKDTNDFIVASIPIDPLTIASLTQDHFTADHVQKIIQEALKSIANNNPTVSVSSIPLGMYFGTSFKILTNYISNNSYN